MKYLSFCLLILSPFVALGQSYTTYFTGNTTNVNANAAGGICLMGGATENDEAMRWFLQRAGGGDVLVLRTSGSDGYNDYLYSDLGLNLNSVETIVFNNPSAAFDTYVHQQIMEAEAIWFAGGNQWNYVSYWRDTPVDSLINDAIVNRNIVIGGTSAGMAIQGGFYFSAQNGTVTSAAALANPYDDKVVVDSSAFIQNEYLRDVITDSHYDDPDRKGRHIAFLARIYSDYGIAGKGIACDEYTAVCIDGNGLARVFGGYPTNDDNAYFIQTNCELDDVTPENCSPNNPLDWNLNGDAIKVYKVKGTNSGAYAFNISDWKTGSGGVWENWSIDNGDLVETLGNPIDCTPSDFTIIDASESLKIAPNPCRETVKIETENNAILEIMIMNLDAKVLKSVKDLNTSNFSLDTYTLPPGFYVLKVQTKNGTVHRKLLKS